jgi:hypothetical protein
MTSPSERVTSVGSGEGPRRGRGSTAKPRTVTTRNTTKTRTAVGQKDLVDAMSTALSVVLMAYFQWIAKAPREVRDTLDPTTDEADAFVTPFAKLINRPSFGNAASSLVGGADWFVALAAAMSYTDRVAPVVRRHRVIKSTQPVQENKTNGNIRQAQEKAAENAVGYVPGAAGTYGIGAQATVD